MRPPGGGGAPGGGPPGGGGLPEEVEDESGGYEAAILELAEELSSTKGELNEEDAQRLWAELPNQGAVGESESAAMQYILNTYPWNEAGRAELEARIAKGKP